jgi:hypothetical protein
MNACRTVFSRGLGAKMRLEGILGVYPWRR